MKPGWKKVRFEDAVQNVNERVDDPSKAGVERYVGLEHLDPESLKVRRWGIPTDVEATKLRFYKGDVIFGKRRAYQRKLAVADFDGICSAHAMVLRAKPEVLEPEILPLFLQTEVFFERALAISVGSLSPTINWKTLAEQEFGLPPLVSQKKIAALLWAADSAMERWKDALNSAETTRRIAYTQSLFPGQNHLSYKVTEIGQIPKSWAVKRIGDAGQVQLGRQRSPKYQTGDATRPYLRVANVFDGFLKLDDVLTMDFDENDYRRYVLKSGDILLNEGQSKELVGRSCIYRDEIEGCCFQNTLLRFRCLPDLMPEFAHAFFQSLYYKGEFTRIARQTTSIAHLGADRFASLFIPVPPMKEQAQICEQIESLNRLSVDVARHKENTLELKKSLLSSLLS